MGLNKACLKDPFPLPHIDQVVDSTTGCETLCFLDVYSEYHLIAMCIADQLATSFITRSAHIVTRQCPSGSRTRVLSSSDACDVFSGN
jgi:hypothetical protein